MEKGYNILFAYILLKWFFSIFGWWMKTFASDDITLGLDNQPEIECAQS